MHPCLFAALVALYTPTLALPTSHMTNKNTTGFTVQQIDTGRKILRDPIAEVMKTYLKYEGAAPQHIVEAAAAAKAAKVAKPASAEYDYQYGSVEADPQGIYDGEYLSPVTVGTPGQSLVLDFDTGSSDFWVLSDQISPDDLNGQSVYSPSQSSTSSQQPDESWSIHYLSGAYASGNVYSDILTLGSVLAQMSVETATTVSPEFARNSGRDGLLGLAWDSINTCNPNKCPTLMDTIWYTLPSPLFTSSLQHQSPGSYDFGYIDGNKYTGDITYVDIDNSAGVWQFQLDGYQIDDYYVSYNYYYSPTPVVADTGTTFIFLPSSIVNSFYASVPGATNSGTQANLWEFPCDASLPALTLAIGGAYFDVAADYINHAPRADGSCVGSLQSSDGMRHSILGNIFLKSRFVVWDYGNQRLGFAAQP